MSDSFNRVGHRNRRNRSIGASVNRSHHRLMKFTGGKRSCCIVYNNHSSFLVDDRKCRSDRVGPFASAGYGNIGRTRFNEFSAFTLLTWSENNNNVISSGTTHSERVINYSIVAKKFVLLWRHAKAAT
jgi:hypothetical protein